MKGRKYMARGGAMKGTKGMAKGGRRRCPPLGLFLDMLFESLILVEFCLICENFDGGMVKNTFFLMVGLSIR